MRNPLHTVSITFANRISMEKYINQPKPGVFPSFLIIPPVLLMHFLLVTASSDSNTGFPSPWVSRHAAVVSAGDLTFAAINLGLVFTPGFLYVMFALTEMLSSNTGILACSKAVLWFLCFPILPLWPIFRYV